MGKVRAKTIGDEGQEQKEREEAEKRRLAKIEVAKAAGKATKGKALSVKGEEKNSSRHSELDSESSVIANEVKQSTFPVIPSEAEGSSPKTEIATSQAPRNDEKEPKKREFVKKDFRSANYKKAAALIEKNKTYALSEALELLEKTHLATFDETVELHINATQSLTGNMQLPHGTGKSTRVAILSPSKDAAGAGALLKDIAEGKITFDVLVATPDAMPALAKVARVLGPKGLMPNPKNGTVTPDPDSVAKKYLGGHMTFKTESKSPVLHLVVGKLSFGNEKLSENITAAIQSIKSANMKNVTLKSTMSPGIRLKI